MVPALTSAKRECSLLLLAATPAEERGLEEAADELGVPFETIELRDSPFGEEYRWFGAVGNETVIALGPVRSGGRTVMGSIGFLGTAARGMRLRAATGAQGIVQLGMAFGIDPATQNPGDVLISTSLIPYDNRDIRAAPPGMGYVTDYSQAAREPAMSILVERFRREQQRGGHSFAVHFGAILSGAARIHTRIFRDELVRGVPQGKDPIVGGEMEAVGLLAASPGLGMPIWCVAKAISDFADENRDAVIRVNRPSACRNAARFVLSALRNDT